MPYFTRKRLLLGLALAAAAGAVLFYQRPSARMRRQVDYWAHGYQWAENNVTRTESHRAYRSALQKMDGQAVPYLVEDLARRDSFMDKVHLFLISRFDYRSRRPPGFFFRTQAAEALGHIGPAARAAIPDLLTHATTDDINVRRAAMISLTLIGDGQSNVVATAAMLTNHSYRALAVVSKICLAVLQPANEVLVQEANAAIGATAAINEGGFYWIPGLVEDLGERGRPFLPGLKMAITNQSCPSFLTEHFGRVNAARALWHLEGSSAAALETLNIFTNAASMGRTFKPVEFDHSVCALARDFGEIPEFRAALEPLLQKLDASHDASLREEKTAALRLLKRLREAAETNVVPGANQKN